MISRTDIRFLSLLLAAGVIWPLPGCQNQNGSTGPDDEIECNLDGGERDAGDSEDEDANTPSDAGTDARVDAGRDAGFDARADSSELDGDADPGDAVTDATEAGPDADAAETGSCPQCPNNRCLPDLTTCIECSADLACVDTALKCDTASNRCVPCLPSADDCPRGSYCEGNFSCVPGCKSGDDCSSGRCNAQHECVSCVRNDECGDGRVCGTFECGAACGGASDPACGTGTQCCSGQCVDVARDIEHCGGCGMACTANQFCARSGCTPVALGKLCESQNITIVLSGLGGDANESAALEASLSQDCVPAVTVSSVLQTETPLVNPKTGQPFAGGNNLLITLGSAYANKLVQYMEATNLAPIELVPLPTETPLGFEFRHTATDRQIMHGVVDDETPTRAHFLLQTARDPISGSLIISAYGYWAEGTVAARWYIANVVVPALSTFTNTWYLYRWEDSGEPGPSPADTFTLVDSGT